MIWTKAGKRIVKPSAAECTALGLGSGLGLGGGSTSALAFNPTTSVAGIALWLRADLGVTIGTGVSAWADQSGTGDAAKNCAQAVGAQQPTRNATDAAYNNQTTLSFASAASQFLRSAAWAAAVVQPYTIFVVGNDDGTGNRQDFLDNQAGTQTSCFENNGGGASYSIYANGGALLTSSGAVSNAPRVLAGMFSDAASLIFNSAKTATGGPGTAAGTNSRTGVTAGATGTGTLPLNGKIAEIIIYSGDIGATNRALVWAYLGTRYGIAIAA